MDGMAFSEYRTLTMRDRWELHEELTDLIERTQPDSDGTPHRPKDFRK